MDKIRIGIVGCGAVARKHLNAYRQTDECEVVSVFDSTLEAATAFAGELTGARAASSLEGMLDAHGVQAVSICTPPAAHLDCCRPFLRAGVPVLCEKPLEATVGGAEQLFSLAETSCSIFMVGFNHRFQPAIIELKKLIDSGVLGRPVLFRNIFGGYLRLDGNHRIDPRLSGGGCLIDHGCHSVDLFRHLVGEPEQVQAWACHVLQDVPIEDLGMITLTHNGGQSIGQITASYSLKVCGNWLEWYGTRGTAIVSYGNENSPDLKYKAEGQNWAVVDCSQHPADRYLGEIRNFITCVRKGAQGVPTVFDGLLVSRISAAAYQSAAESNRAITLAPSAGPQAPQLKGVQKSWRQTASA